MSTFGLASKVVAHPGQEEALTQVLLEFSRLVYRASGCLSYVVSRVANQPGALFVTEYWASQQAHREALDLPGLFELMDQCQPLMQDLEQAELLPVNH